jgi:multidrug transporter EmrE-like cation transporter
MSNVVAKRRPQRIKFTVINTIGMVAAVCAIPWALICLKLSSEVWDKKTEWWDVMFWSAIGYFVLGNIVGLTTTIGKTIALRDNPPNLIYALVSAPSVILIHLALAWKFNTNLVPMQWLAIGVIVCGAILLQSGSRSGEDEAIADVVQHLAEGEADSEIGQAQ